MHAAIADFDLAPRGVYAQGMIFAGFAETLGRPHGGGGHRSGGGGRHYIRPGSFRPYDAGVYPEYVAPVILTTPAPCTQFPNPVPPCAGTLVWTDAKTICCR